jgi:hypothetical protein
MPSTAAPASSAAALQHKMIRMKAGYTLVDVLATQL